MVAALLIPSPILGAYGCESCVQIDKTVTEDDLHCSADSGNAIVRQFLHLWVLAPHEGSAPINNWCHNCVMR
eukprot:4510905-Amphidinium_carterae.1